MCSGSFCDELDPRNTRNNHISDHRGKYRITWLDPLRRHLQQESDQESRIRRTICCPSIYKTTYMRVQAPEKQRSASIPFFPLRTEKEFCCQLSIGIALGPTGRCDDKAARAQCSRIKAWRTMHRTHSPRNPSQKAGQKERSAQAPGPTAKPA